MYCNILRFLLIEWIKAKKKLNASEAKEVKYLCLIKPMLIKLCIHFCHDLAHRQRFTLNWAYWNSKVEQVHVNNFIGVKPTTTVPGHRLKL